MAAITEGMNPGQHVGVGLFCGDRDNCPQYFAYVIRHFELIDRSRTESANANAKVCLSPEQVAEEEGFHLLAWVGDHFQIPTVGVAVDPVHIPLDSPALQALVRANQWALQTMADRPDLAVDYIASFLNRLTREEAQRYYEHYIAPYYTSDGQADLTIAQQAIDAVAAELGVAAVAADSIYAPSP